jgi:hypothetical protein
MNASDSPTITGENNISSGSGSLIASLSSVQKTSLVILLATLSLVVWSNYTRATGAANSYNSEIAKEATATDELNLIVTSPDQVLPAHATESVSNVNGENIQVNYQSRQTSSGNAVSESSSSLTVNGVQVPVSNKGNVRKVIKSSGGNSSVIVNVDSQSSSSGQSGGGN